MADATLAVSRCESTLLIDTFPRDAACSTSHRSSVSNVSCGRKLQRISGFRQIPAMTQCRLASITTGPLIPRWVQSRLPLRRSIRLLSTKVDSSTSMEIPDRLA